MYYGLYESNQNRDALERERLMRWTETSQVIEADDPLMLAFDPRSFFGFLARLFGFRSEV